MTTKPLLMGDGIYRNCIQTIAQMSLIYVKLMLQHCSLFDKLILVNSGSKCALCLRHFNLLCFTYKRQIGHMAFNSGAQQQIQTLKF
jgi:hypothetical protein